MRSTARAYAPTLAPQARELVVAALAQRPRGFLTDIDGTLAAIAPTPDQARLTRGMRPLLRRCLTMFDVVAAISGRPALDARRMVGVAELTYIGNHGMEWLAPHARLPQIAPEVRRYEGAIADTLHEAREQLGAWSDTLLFENKGVTASIHYRLAPDPAAARAAVLRVLDPLAQRHQLRLTEGRMVVELRPPVELDKGTSARALVQRRSLASAIYLGDDLTDVDAFRALRQLRAEGGCLGVAVAIGHAEAPAALLAAADVTLSSIAEAPSFIRWLLRIASTTPTPL